MLGRGALACPDLPRRIRSGGEEPAMSWRDTTYLLERFCTVTEAAYDRKYVGNRVKQWLAYLRRHYPEAGVLFESVKRLRWPEPILQAIREHRLELDDRHAA